MSNSHFFCGRHTVELAAGGIERYGIAPGERLEYPALAAEEGVVPGALRHEKTWF